MNAVGDEFIRRWQLLLLSEESQESKERHFRWAKSERDDCGNNDMI